VTLRSCDVVFHNSYTITFTFLPLLYNIRLLENVSPSLSGKSPGAKKGLMHFEVKTITPLMTVTLNCFFVICYMSDVVPIEFKGACGSNVNVVSEGARAACPLPLAAPLHVCSSDGIRGCGLYIRSL